jgi:hypothetical protein
MSSEESRSAMVRPTSIYHITVADPLSTGQFCLSHNRPAQRMVIELAAESFDEGVETMRGQKLIQPPVEGMPGPCGSFAVAIQMSSCCSTARLPNAMRKSP